MAKFKYKAMDAKGSETEGVIEADKQATALSRIREQGLFPTSVEEVGAPKKGGKAAPKGQAAAGGAPPAKGFSLPFLGGRVKSKQLMGFTRQLSTLVNAGLPLLRGLQVLQRQERNPTLKRAINDMAESIQSGSTLGEALAHHPKIFNRLYVNMAKAGEVGGVLDQVLNRLAEFMEKAQRIKSKVFSAMLYPVVVLIMAFGILSFLMLVIIPKFKEIFDDLLEGQALPPLTQAVMNISTSFGSRLPYLIVGIVVLVVVLKLMRTQEWGRYALDRFKMRMPLFGPLMKKTAIGRFTRTLGTLMNAGVPVLQALNIVRDTAGSEVVARAVNTVHDAVKEGENMAPPIESVGLFPPMVISMVEVGEETGGLPEMLIKIADTYDDEVDTTVAGLTSIIEPILIIFLAVVVGTIVIALFMPLISIIGSLS
ncbi:MAG: type II secretion system F family protein [Candidatus Marinimicrobia bacterium]|nr:type II secretion system F family protein [Candidatus Neomarinimicrobiota bacterium]